MTVAELGLLTYTARMQGSKASATSSVVNLRRRQSLRNALVEKLLAKYFPGRECVHVLPFIFPCRPYQRVGTESGKTLYFLLLYLCPLFLEGEVHD